MVYKFLLLIFLSLFATQTIWPGVLVAQDIVRTVNQDALPHQTLNLTNRQAFRPVKNKNWHLAGDVFADRKKENHLLSEAGTGILVYQPKRKNKPLQTKLQHGDLDLELNFLLAKGTSIAIGLQGRYYLNLKDSWLQQNLTPADCGGISAGTNGISPLMNATKTPGLWQHLSVSFIAPRFDKNGKKIADALITKVILNGRLIQENVVLTVPTGKALIPGEAALGPLVIEGGAGRAAFKNIRYKTYNNQRLVLENLQYRLHKGRFRELDKLSVTAPVKSGPTDSLSHRLGNEDELLTVEGEIEAPVAGAYLFRVAAGGPVWIFLDNQLVVDNKGSRDFQRFYYGSNTLSPGRHPFKIIFSNHDKSLVLEYEGPHIPWTTLTTPASRRKVLGQEPLVYHVKNDPVLQRGFIQHQQGTNTYAAAVGIPGGLNFAYDLNAYTLLSVWHGNYLDVAHMWRDRGEKQLAQPIGPELQLSGLPTITILKGQTDVWPDSIHPDSSPYTDKGYKLHPNGLPVFFYALPNVNIEDYLAPNTGREGLTREITVKSTSTQDPLYLLLATGRNIQKLPNGAYAIDNKSYYLEDIEADNGQPLLRTSNGQTQLLLPLNSPTSSTQVKYSIIW